VTDAHALVRQALAGLPEPDLAARAAVARRAAEVLRPSGALARLDDVAAWLAGWQRTDRPRVERPAAVVFAGAHGVVAEGVSAYGAEVNREMLRALRSGAATASVMARQLGARLEVVDVGVERPTGNIRRVPALSMSRFEECMAVGRETVAAIDADILVLGEMGIGNTTAAAAVCAALFAGRSADWTGRGTGLDDVGLRRKLAVVGAARRRVGREADPLEILRQVGGAELVALAGAALEARLRSLPVILDGYVVGAAVAALAVAQPGALDHCLAGHVSAEVGHGRLLARLGMRPLLDLGMRLGEASGALAALALVRLAAACVTDVATFAEWGMAQ
jgi:nicotinate-nucleotide--dimethylbenzimidazole phosphoribosyltransferase